MATLSDLPDYAALCQVQNALWGTKDVRGAAIMVGAGFSKFCRLASDTGRSPPLWKDFDAEMRKRLHEEKLPTDPLKLAEQYRAALGSHALDALIRELVCDQQWTPGELHSRLLGLPWADVLTTNWDTLLERTQLPEADRSYEVVRVLSDIARTRAPRIVKLHGSLPAHAPFIFTAEDFRTYPQRFAPFVNLAQQVLLENELCLIGFSGDDPNFLQWSGWVRDQLGASARKIRLIGALNLSPSRRQVLEQYNVSPIDLGPLVQHFDPSEQHYQATKLFLDGLWAAKPKPNFVWKRHETKISPPDKAEQSPPEQFIKSSAHKWQDDRNNYPGWLVAPASERAAVLRDTSSAYPDIWKALPQVSAETRAAIVIELVWRYEIAFCPLTKQLRVLAEEVSIDAASGLTSIEREEIIFALARSARRERDWPAFDKAVARIALSSRPEAKAMLAYERALRFQATLDFENLQKCIGDVTGDDPVWALRRAALLCSLQEDRKAAETLFEALNKIKARRIQDRDSVWLLSREAWAAWLMNAARFTLRDIPELKKTEEFDRWPIKYKAAECDPWDELVHLDREIGEESNHRLQAAKTIEPKFDPGTYQDHSRTIRFGGGANASSLDQLIALSERVGLPDTIDHTNILGTRFVRSLEALNDNSTPLVWRAAFHLSSATDGLIDRYFSRIEVARYPLDLVIAIIDQLKKAIEYARLHLPAHDWVSPTVRNMELLSRLVVRLPTDKAVETFQWAIELSKDSRWNHWWLFEPLDHLLNRSLEAVSPSSRGALVLSAIQLKLPEEANNKGPEHHWPEIAFSFRNSDYALRDGSHAWSHRISELIEAVRTHTPVSRARAAWRLFVLYKGGALTESESAAFGQALWDRRVGTDGLPEHTDLYGHVFLRLPEPTPGLARDVFEKSILEVLATGKIDAFRLVSLGGSAIDESGNAVVTPISVSDAISIFDACLSWTPAVLEMPDFFGKTTQLNDEIAGSIGACLTYAVLPNVSAADIGPQRAEKWKQAVIAGTIPTLVHTAAEFVRIFPDREQEAVSWVRRALASRVELAVSSAISAVIQFMRSNDKCRPFPTVLASDIVTLCAVRREPGLTGALNCSRKLLLAGLIIPDDKKRLAEALEFLLVETEYQNWDALDSRTRSLSLVRRECVRLADALKKDGMTNEAIEGWIKLAQDDAIPEVRFALMDEK